MDEPARSGVHTLGWHTSVLGVLLAILYGNIGGCTSHTSSSNLDGEEVDICLPATPRPADLGSRPGLHSVTVREIRSDDWFEDYTEQSGIRFAHRNGRDAGRFYMIESFGGGVAMIDFDLDDQIDLFFSGGGTISAETPSLIGGVRPAFYRNAGAWRFPEVTVAAGLGLPPDYSQGCAVTDWNSDGFPDLFLCCYGRSRLYSNMGDGTFCELEEESLPARGWATAAAFGDIDRDRQPDLFVARYTDWSPESDKPCLERGSRDLCGPTSYSGTTCQFWHNSGDGRFEDWSDRVGLQGNVHGLGVISTDLNGDGWVDFYVSNDALPNHLYLGGANSQLVESALVSGVAFGEWGQAEASMGLDVADFNGDGLPDIFTTNFEKEDNSLYRNIGDGQWMHATVSTGLSGVSRMRVGFGTSLSDFDSDGWPDLFVLNGNPIYATAETPYEQSPQLFRNLLGRRFEEVSEQGGTYFQEAHSGRGNAVGDLDNDGALDLVTVLMNRPVRVQRNRKVPKSYVRVLPVACQGESDATGARVISPLGGRQLVQFVKHGAGFFSESDPRIMIPLDPEAQTTDVTIAWPGRETELFRGLSVRQTHRLLEGRGESLHE